MNFWAIPKEWVGETCAIFGGGPSMSLEIADQLKGRCRAIAVNNTGIDFVNQKGNRVPAMAPWADILYASDALWWYHNKESAQRFAGRRVTSIPNGAIAAMVPTIIEDTWIMQNGGPHGFDDRPTHIRTGHNSGYQAMHIAAHYGAKRILLVGFDMHGRRGEHYFGDHKWRVGFKSLYHTFIDAFNAGAPEFEKRGYEIINCTPGSALECFPFMDLEEALNGVRPMREVPKAFTGINA